jgi:hypothetical protein
LVLKSCFRYSIPPLPTLNLIPSSESGGQVPHSAAPAYWRWRQLQKLLLIHFSDSYSCRLRIVDTADRADRTCYRDSRQGVLTSGASHSRDAPGTLNRHVIMVSVTCAEDEYTTGCTLTSRSIPSHLNPSNHRPDCFNVVSDFSYQCRSFPYRAVLHRNPP